MFKYNSITLWNRLLTHVQNIENYMQLKENANVSNNLWMFLCIFLILTQFYYGCHMYIVCIVLILTHNFICF